MHANELPAFAHRHALSQSTRATFCSAHQETAGRGADEAVHKATEAAWHWICFELHSNSDFRVTSAATSMPFAASSILPAQNGYAHPSSRKPKRCCHACIRLDRAWMRHTDSHSIPPRIRDALEKKHSVPGQAEHRHRANPAAVLL